MSDAVAADERFLAAVRGRLAEVTVDLRNEELTEIGGQACAALAAGHPRKVVAAEVAEHGLPAADARELVTLARNTLCDTEPDGGAGTTGTGTDSDTADTETGTGSDN